MDLLEGVDARKQPVNGAEAVEIAVVADRDRGLEGDLLKRLGDVQGLQEAPQLLEGVVVTRGVGVVDGEVERERLQARMAAEVDGVRAVVGC